MCVTIMCFYNPAMTTMMMIIIIIINNILIQSRIYSTLRQWCRSVIFVLIKRARMFVLYTSHIYKPNIHMCCVSYPGHFFPVPLINPSSDEIRYSAVSRSHRTVLTNFRFEASCARVASHSRLLYNIIIIIKSTLAHACINKIYHRYPHIDRCDMPTL